jgi:signal transduction histidine kinase
MTLVFGVGMAVVLAGLGAFVYVRVKGDLLAAVDAGLRSRAQLLANAAGRAGELGGDLGEGRLADADEAFAQVLDASGRIVAATSAVSNAPLLSVDEVRAVTKAFFVTRQVEELQQYDALDDPIRLLATAVGEPARDVVVVGATLSDVNEALQRLIDLMSVAGPVAILVTAGAAWLFAGAALHPVELMRRDAAAVSASEPSRRLPVPRSSAELARLATTLNSMLDRLQEAIERERQFVDTASHELRTPLATLRAEVELALVRRREAPELEASLRSALEDINHLQRLAEDLLVLARSRGGQIPIRRVRTRLDALVSKCLQVVNAQSHEAGVTIDVDRSDDTVELDPDRVHQALRNILENAVRHSPRGGVVRLSAGRTNGTVRFVIADSGPGFPADLLASAFDPFARGRRQDPGSPGTGLGLAIARAVAQAHGGSAFAENTPSGARVTLELQT